MDFYTFFTTSFHIYGWLQMKSIQCLYSNLTENLTAFGMIFRIPNQKRHQSSSNLWNKSGQFLLNLKFIFVKRIHLCYTNKQFSQAFSTLFEISLMNDLRFGEWTRYKRLERMKSDDVGKILYFEYLEYLRLRKELFGTF